MVSPNPSSRYWCCATRKLKLKKKRTPHCSQHLGLIPIPIITCFITTLLLLVTWNSSDYSGWPLVVRVKKLQHLFITRDCRHVLLGPGLQLSASMTDEGTNISVLMLMAKWPAVRESLHPSKNQLVQINSSRSVNR